MNKILVTGGAGFIGSCFVRIAMEQGYQVTVLDALTYAGHMENLQELTAKEGFEFVQGNIQDFSFLEKLFSQNKFTGVVNFAAESHVDNSIRGPQAFIETNILGTFQLLEASRKYWMGLAADEKKNFRFLHVSTDEVFGALGAEGRFTEASPYAPNSPYSASKAGSDHLVRAWFHTYGLPTITTNCSNNYGPRQFPEKLIPLMIQQALAGEKLPVYGQGLNIRDWIHVKDHCLGVLLALSKGQPGETYCFGGNSEKTNIDVVRSICRLLDKLAPKAEPYEKQIEFVQDRAGHDFRYAIDDQKAQKELHFERGYENFEDGLKATLQWYLRNQEWVKAVGQKKQS